MLDQVEKAQQALERLIKAIERDWRFGLAKRAKYKAEGPSWLEEMAERAKYLSQLLTVDPEAAKRQLAEWEQLTVKNLKYGWEKLDLS